MSSAWPANVKGVHHLLEWAAIDGKEPLIGYAALPDPGRGVPYESPVFVLAERISEEMRDSALEILRRPIIVPQAVSLSEFALIKVCCKRLRIDPTFLSKAMPAEFLSQPRAGQCQGTESIRDAVEHPTRVGSVPVHLPAAECLTVKSVLAELVSRQQSSSATLNLLDAVATALGPGRVGAALVRIHDAEVEVLRIAFNLPKISHLLHAEYVLLRGERAAGSLNLGHSPSRHSASVTLLSTRKPCRMCAAIILDVMGHDCPKVLYRHYDWGPMAAKTVLNAHSFDRSWLPLVHGEREEQLT